MVIKAPVLEIYLFTQSVVPREWYRLIIINNSETDAFLGRRTFPCAQRKTMHIFLDRKTSRGSSNHTYLPCVDNGAEPWVPCGEPTNTGREQSKWGNYSLPMGLCTFLTLGCCPVVCKLHIAIARQGNQSHLKGRQTSGGACAGSTSISWIKCNLRNLTCTVAETPPQDSMAP